MSGNKNSKKKKPTFLTVCVLSKDCYTQNHRISEIENWVFHFFKNFDVSHLRQWFLLFPAHDLFAKKKIKISLFFSTSAFWGALSGKCMNRHTDHTAGKSALVPKVRLQGLGLAKWNPWNRKIDLGFQDFNRDVKISTEILKFWYHDGVMMVISWSQNLKCLKSDHVWFWESRNLDHVISCTGTLSFSNLIMSKIEMSQKSDDVKIWESQKSDHVKNENPRFWKVSMLMSSWYHGKTFYCCACFHQGIPNDSWTFIKMSFYFFYVFSMMMLSCPCGHDLETWSSQNPSKSFVDDHKILIMSKFENTKKLIMSNFENHEILIMSDFENQEFLIMSNVENQEILIIWNLDHTH